MPFLGSGKFDQNRIRRQLKDISRIALSYQDQIKALVIIERIYGEAMEERPRWTSKLLADGEYFDLTRTQPVSGQIFRSKKEDRVKTLYYRMRDCYNSGNIPSMRGLEIITEEELIGYASLQIPPSGTNQVYRQKIGRGRTDA